MSKAYFPFSSLATQRKVQMSGNWSSRNQEKGSQPSREWWHLKPALGHIYRQDFAASLPQ